MSRLKRKGKVSGDFALRARLVTWCFAEVGFGLLVQIASTYSFEAVFLTSARGGAFIAGASCLEGVFWESMI